MIHHAASPMARLRQYARREAARERCELCSAAIADEHEHLYVPADRQLICACSPCAILFGHREGTKYRRVPRDATHLTRLRLSDLQWEAFGLPIALAFFQFSSHAGRMVAVYPSPAGATESAVPLDSWSDFVADNPNLGNLEPDVEALLVNRIGAKRDYFRVGIDRCFRMAGLLRLHWRGMSGGDKVWTEIDSFFADLKAKKN